MVDSKVGNIIVCGKKRTLYVGNKGGIFYRSKGAKVYVNKKNVEDMMNFGGLMRMMRPKSGSQPKPGPKPRQASPSRSISPMERRLPPAPHAEAARKIHHSFMNNASPNKRTNPAMRGRSNAISGW